MPRHFSGSGGAFSRASACPLLGLGVNLSYNGSMELTLQLQLLPAADQRPVLLATMERFNEAAMFAAKVGFEPGVFSQPSNKSWVAGVELATASEPQRGSLGSGGVALRASTPATPRCNLLLNHARMALRQR